jgi:hypothetical protein
LHPLSNLRLCIRKPPALHLTWRGVAGNAQELGGALLATPRSCKQLPSRPQQLPSRLRASTAGLTSSHSKLKTQNLKLKTSSKKDF